MSLIRIAGDARVTATTVECWGQLAAALKGNENRHSATPDTQNTQSDRISVATPAAKNENSQILENKIIRTFCRPQWLRSRSSWAIAQ
ncbi:MAG: hypothetical protein B7Y80_08145 [Hyphomicrobium sp. 32-62-53]|nr:MAG: hypothetical protein B7Y80_08145 [Hyphomicrobium sp. 32-62-53]